MRLQLNRTFSGKRIVLIIGITRNTSVLAR